MLVLLSFLCLSFLLPVSAVLPDILQTCTHVSCDVDDEYSKYSAVNPAQNFKWIAAGLPLIFWESVADDSLFAVSNVSSGCRRQLHQVSRAMASDSEWGYKFLDSSGKSPAGLFKSTPTAIGEYDECLAIDSNGIHGQYCMIDMHHLRKNTTSEQMDFSRFKVVPDYPFFSALCLPSACSARETQSALKQLLKPYFIRVAGHISCDTLEDTTWSTKFKNLTKKQMVAAAFISSILMLTVLGTVIDLRQGNKSSVIEQPLHKSRPGLLVSVSMRTVSRKLFYAKAYNNYDFVVIDGLKFFAIVLGVMAHIGLCAESPISYATFANLDYLDQLWRSLLTQVTVNDSGLVMISLMTGMGCFSVLYPIAKQQKVPYISAIIDRVSRFFPHVLLLTACEMLWPISGSGPFFTRTANFVHQRCDNNWWYNLIFLNNFFIEGIDACATHLFWISVDVQLFIAGVFAIYLFSKSDAAGLLFCSLMVALGVSWTGVTAYVKESAISFYYINPDPVKINDYYTDIYEKPTSWCSAYFIGMIMAFLRTKGYICPTFQGLWKNIAFCFFCCFAFWFPYVNYALYNVWEVYTPSDSWLFIPMSRILMTLGFFAFYLCFMSLKPHLHSIWDAKRESHDTRKVQFHFFKALVRLLLPLNLCNYMYIRYEFFTRRFLYPNSHLWLVIRMLSSLFIIFIFSLVFQLFLLGPIDAIRQTAMSSIRSRKQVKLKAEQKVEDKQQEIPMVHKSEKLDKGMERSLA